MPSGFVISSRAQRAAQFIFPPQTRVELATRALDTLVPRWVENLWTRENLELVSDIDIKGPLFCPWIDEGKFGEDMWVASGLFTSRRPREVNEDFLWASRELAQEVGISDDTTPRIHRALPRDFMQQMNFVKTHAEKVYDDLRELKTLEVGNGEDI